MKNIIIILAAILAAGVIGLGAITYFGSTPLTKEEAIKTIGSLVQKEIGKNNVSQAIVMVSSTTYDIEEVFGYGNVADKPVGGDTPFHVASVGKAFTATLIGKLIDSERISLDDRVNQYLDQSVLEGIFVVDGEDYQNEVTIGQLLNHTSGIADYYEDTVIDGLDMKAQVIATPDRMWTPLDLIAFTRDYQSAVGKPGEVYHYSDTGYILLGLIIEKIYGSSFDQVLYEQIFRPLHMNDTYLLFYSQPPNGTKPIADINFYGEDIKDSQSISMDWAGGGVVSTANDLTTFVRALNQGEVIRASTMESLYRFDQKFMQGIHYGYGFMEYHFGEFFPTMKSMPNYVGHMGVLGTQMFYDKKTDTAYVSSLGSTDASAASVRLMIRVLSTLSRIK